MKFFFVMLLLFVAQAAFASTGVDKVASANPASFHLQGETSIPDGALKAGSYSIRISDHLADRVVVEVQGVGGTTEKFLGVPAKNISNSLPAGPVIVSGAEGKSALRGFAFGKGNVVEFVYPKNDAVALAKASGSTVLAIDPASEGMALTAGLSAADRKIVTLWMLTPTLVGAGDAAQSAIKAARYDAPISSNNERVEARPAVLARLPKTASNFPLLCIMGFGSLALALLLSLFRLRGGVN